MTAKEYLIQYKLLTYKLADKAADIIAIRAEMESISPNLDGLPRGENISDRTGRLAVRLADIESDYEEDRARAWRRRIHIVEDIDRLYVTHLDNPEYARLLHLRYVELCTWTNIAVAMSYSEEYTRGALHDAALKAFTEVHKEKLNRLQNNT